MGDVGDYWNDVKEYYKEKKNLYRSGKMKEDISLVVNNSAHIEEKNGGEHLIVTAENGRVIDYWPSTKRWISRRYKGKGYDTQSLVNYLKKQKDKT